MAGEVPQNWFGGGDGRREVVVVAGTVVGLTSPAGSTAGSRDGLRLGRGKAGRAANQYSSTRLVGQDGGDAGQDGGQSRAYRGGGGLWR